MARSLSQTLTRTPHSYLFATKSPPTLYVSRILTFRTRSSQPDNSSELADPILAVADSDFEQQREALAVKKLEDAIHRIIVKRSEPNWLPFVPGSSYWVPPKRKSYGIADLVGKLANTLTDEEVMSLTTLRGWPSSAFFVDGASPHPAKEDANSKNLPQSADEDE